MATNITTEGGGRMSESDDPFRDLSALCREPFWNPSTTWLSEEPNIGSCIERTILVWVPCLMLWLSGLPYLIYIRGRSYNPIPWTGLSCTKVMVSILILAVAATELAWASTAGIQLVPPADFIAPVVIFVTQVFHIILVLLGRRKGLQNSGVLFLFWLFSLLCGLPQIYTSFIVILGRADTLPPLLAGTFIVHYLCTLTLFGANCICDSPSISKRMKVTEKPSPRTEASFLNNLFFFWTIGLIWRGWRRPLTSDDLWDVEPKDSTLTVAAQWDAAMSGDHGVTPNVLRNEESFSKKKIRVTGPQVSVLACIWRMVRVRFLLCGFLYLGAEVSRFITPQILSLIINFMTDSTQPVWHGYLYAVCMFMSCMATTLIKNQYFFTVFRLAIRIRSSIMTAVYRKALMLSGAARRDSTVGEIVNLMAVDAQYVGETMVQLWNVVGSPIVILVSTAFLWQELGPSVLAGLGVLIVLLPLNSFVTNKMKALTFSALKFRDQRVKMVSEIVNGIKVLKLYAWEGAFANKVEETRAEEIRLLRKVALYKACNSFIFNTSPYLVALFTFTTYLLVDPANTLDAQKAFVSISLFNIMRLPMIQLPSVISQLIQSSVALKRVQEFISADELDPTAVSRDYSEDGAVIIRGGHFSWESDEDQSSWQLANIDLSVGHGQLVAIVGTVGSGKSSLISAILGEMKKEKGKVVVNGRLAYVSQQAWLQNATLRDNIVWGQPFDEKRYREVVSACALQPDLEMLPGGDMTEIGEKGINLSGGQKQRVSLARAAYSDADIVLFDDPLSAVDAHVGRHIFDKVIGPQGILKDRTRILVTHAVTFLPRVDEVVVMKDGQVAERGSYAALVAKEGDFANFVLQHINDASDDEAEEEFDEIREQLEKVQGSQGLLRQLSMRSSKNSVNNIGSADDITTRYKRNRSISETVTNHFDHQEFSYSSLNRKAKRQYSIREHVHMRSLQNKRSLSYTNGIARSQNGLHGSKLSVHSVNSGRSEVDMVTELEEPQLDNGDEDRDDDGIVKGQKLVQEETSETGKVARKMYILYGKSMGIFFALAPIILISLGQASIAASNIWLSAWTSTEEELLASNTSSPESISIVLKNSTDHINPNYTVSEPTSTSFVITRDVFLAGYSVFGVAQAVFLFIGITLLMIGCLKSSRVLHQQLLDSVVRLPMSFFDTNPSGRIINRFSKEISVLDNNLPDMARALLSCLTQVLATLTVIIVATPVAGIFILPIMAVYYFLQLVYIASSRQLKRIESVSKSPIYSHFSETLQGVSVIRAYKRQQEFYEESERKIEFSLKAVYVNLATNRCVAVFLEVLGNLITLAAAVVGVAGRGNISSGIVGLSLSYSLSVTAVLNWLVRIAADFEANIVSVERISEYVEKEHEAAWTVAETSPSWPEDGHISFRKYQTRYRPGLDLVLKGITCSFKPAEKVGIVGRTGAGKSSLTLALFRLIEAAGGQIEIDKVNIADVGLHDLRGRVSIIPQDPVLFSGSVRLNLDPLDQCSDADIWRALELAHLSDYIRGQPLGLQHPVDEDGSNFSVGQRQLVCLARALLRRSRVLVLDEATAAVDLETDGLIQDTIRSQFADCSVLTIAHRLNTIMDSDRVLVLSEGQISEFDTPSALLADRNSVFYAMAKDAGLV